MTLVEFLQAIRDTFGMETGMTLRATTDPDMDYDAIAIIIEGKDASLYLSFPGKET